VAIDPTKSPLLEKMAAVGIVWVFAMMSFSLVLPYTASYFHLTINEADRALVNSIVSAINNAFVWVLGFLYGQSVGSRQKDATISTAVTTAAKAQDALTPIVAAVAPVVVTPAGNGNVNLQAGDTVSVTAVPAKPENITQEEWEKLSEQEKIERSAKQP
jgi:predicted anti-sigma-YlaC factor YlaD